VTSRTNGKEKFIPHHNGYKDDCFRMIVGVNGAELSANCAADFLSVSISLSTICVKVQKLSAFHASQ